MIKRFLAVLAVLSMITGLTSCMGRNDTSNKDKLSVYYINSASYENGGDYIEAFDYYLSDNEDMINNALDYLGRPPADSGLKSSLVKGTTIYSYDLKDRVIDVNLSPAYMLLNELEKAAVKCCLTLTLCGISEVEYLNIYVDEKLVDEKLEPRMMIIEDTDTNELEKRICLYFPEENNYYLREEFRVLTVGQDVSVAEYVVEELIKSTQAEGLCPSIPEGARLISAELKNGVCIVNFSREFVDSRPVTAAGQRLTIYSIVNSLVGLDNIDAVVFHIEGENGSGYEYIDISDTFFAFEDIVYDPMETSKLFATVYLGNSESGKMVKTPVIIDRDPVLSIEESIVSYVLSLDDIGGYERIIPSAVQMIGIETVNNVCTVDFTAALFAGGTARVATLASCAVAASLIDSGVVNQVTVTVEGRRYLENIELYEELIIE